MATSMLKRQSGGSSSTSNSASSVVSTLAPVALYALIYAILFLVLRRPFKRYYQPRTFLGSLRPEQRSPKLPDSMLGWVGTFWKIPDTESVFYINLRQAYLMSPLYSSRISSRTVLFTSVPAQYMNEQKLAAVLGHGVRRMWFTSDTKELEDKVKERDQAAYKLEGAETKLIVSANKQRLKNEKVGHRAGSDEEAAIGQGSGSAAARYLKPKQRPTHRLKPIIGKKVDTIDWCRAELKKLIPEVDRMQSTEKARQGKMTSSVFVEFETLSEAQAAYQSLTHHQALHILRIKWWELIIRKLATTAFVVALIIFWAIPVAAVGAISNINKLEGTTGFTWLHKIFDPIPSVIMGVITGLLPVVLLAVLMALLPIILRAMAKLGGDPTRSAVELTVQNTYFAFQVVQVFLVATLGSAATSVGGAIAQNPTSAVSVLANNLPQASTFYLSYFLLQGLGVVSGLLVGLVGLVIFMVLGKLLDSTPRKMYKRWISLSGLGWGTVFPIYTNLFVIAICYAAIAPLVLGFAAIGLYLFYIAYRYNLLFVTDASVDTKGRVYPRALQQIFVGLYLAEACLIGLFGIGLGKSIGALGPMILMILMLVFTVLYQSSLNAALTPLIDYLPKTIDAEERRLLAEEIGANGHDYDAVPNKEAQFAHARPANGPAPHKKPNFLSLWLRPDIYQDYETMRRMVPKDIAVHYTQEEERNAFFNPAITQATPLLWIPRDGAGISHQEVRDTRQVIPVTDDGAFLDDKGKIVWDSQDGRPPIYEEVPYY
ncbi:phosphate metabolism protein 7 [Friedmanniomyces endolithicus]|nr:phosphate metabolism protein 7 [Friedmanniomyces endolithicus]